MDTPTFNNECTSPLSNADFGIVYQMSKRVLYKKKKRDIIEYEFFLTTRRSFKLIARTFSQEISRNIFPIFFFLFHRRVGIRAWKGSVNFSCKKS